MLPALLALWTLTACSAGSQSPGGASGGGGTAAYAPLGGEEDPRAAWQQDAARAGESARSAPQRTDATGRPIDRPSDRPEPARPAPAAFGDAHTRVTWEALAVERERFANPRFGRRPTRGALMTQKIVLVNASHPEAQVNRMGRSVRENRGIAVGAISDAEMDMFIRGLEQQGFFRLARPTGGIQALFSGDEARGRVTVERGGESVSLLSMRGQGLDPSTKQIPAMYSQVKQAILVLRNQIPTLSVVGARRDPLSR
jgi:hypothetical protein